MHSPKRTKIIVASILVVLCVVAGAGGGAFAYHNAVQQQLAAEQAIDNAAQATWADYQSQIDNAAKGNTDNANSTQSNAQANTTQASQNAEDTNPALEKHNQLIKRLEAINLLSITLDQSKLKDHNGNLVGDVDAAIAQASSNIKAEIADYYKQQLSANTVSDEEKENRDVVAKKNAALDQLKKTIESDKSYGILPDEEYNSTEKNISDLTEQYNNIVKTLDDKKAEEEKHPSQQPEQAKAQGNARGGQAVNSARGGNGGGQKAYRGGGSRRGGGQDGYPQKPSYTKADKAAGWGRWTKAYGGWGRIKYETYDVMYDRFIKQGYTPEESAKLAKTYCLETALKKHPEEFSTDGE